ncbi:Endo-1,4-beta-xylanase A precursor [compost metagenome]
MAYDKNFNDLNVHWSRKELEVLISRHLVDGMDEHHFSPDSPVTRAQVTKLLTNLLHQEGRLPEQNGRVHSFRDVSDSAWYAEAVRDAAAFGLVEGEDGRFRPDAPITREELAVIIQRILKAETTPAPTSLLSKFADNQDTASWGAEAMSLMVQEGIMNGITDTMLMPKGTTTRAQAAVILVRLLERWSRADK